MKKKMIRYTLDTLPPLADAQRAHLRALVTRRDSDIDTSDISEMTDEQWKNTTRGHFYRPLKRQITARIDANVLDWLKAQGKVLSLPRETERPRYSWGKSFSTVFIGKYSRFRSSGKDKKPYLP